MASRKPAPKKPMRAAKKTPAKKTQAKKPLRMARKTSETIKGARWRWRTSYIQDRSEGYHKDAIEFVRKELAKYKNKDVLVLGTPSSAEASGLKRAVTLDISENIAAGKMKRHVRADAVRLPFKNSAFDAVAATYLMTYTPKAQVAKEMRRVLRTGGTAVLALHHPMSALVRGVGRRVDEDRQAVKRLEAFSKTKAAPAAVINRANEARAALALPTALLPELKPNMFFSEEEIIGFFSKRGFDVKKENIAHLKGRHNQLIGWGVVLRKK